MLKNGVPLADALSFLGQLESGTIAAKEIAQWRERLVSGQGKFSEMAGASRVFPPALFVWTVAQIGRGFGAWVSKRRRPLSKPRHLSLRDVALLDSALFHSGACFNDCYSDCARGRHADFISK